LQIGKVALEYHLVKTELVTTLKRRATKILASLAEHRDPVLITQHGRPAAYLVDVETYEGLSDRLAILEVIARGEQAAEEGRTVSHRTARKRMSRWLR
jgi:prevent-host-death family protein